MARASAAVNKVDEQFRHLSYLHIGALPPDEAGQYVQLVVQADCNDVDATHIQHALKREFAYTPSITFAAKDGPPVTIVPGEGVGEISLGMTVEQATRILGGAEDRKEFDDGRSVFLNYQRTGISLRFNDGQAAVIFVYSGRKGGYTTGEFSRFHGELPRGLDFDSPYDDVIRAFGVPKESGEFSYAPIPSQWLSYGSLGIGFDFIKQDGRIISVHVVVATKK
jgi:hypothetical protein